MKKNYALFLLFAVSFTFISRAQVTLSQTTNNSITTGATNCSDGGVTADNIYYRHFDLAALGYSQFDVNQVRFGVHTASNVDPAFAVTVIIFSHTGAAFPNGTLTQVASVLVPIVAADAGTIKTVPITASVVGPAKLVVALSIPNELEAMHTTRFLIGSNSGGQSAPGYLSSIECGITPPFTITSLGFPNMHIVMTVTGIALSVDEFSMSKVSISPNPTSDYVTIDLDSSNSLSLVEIYSITGQLVYRSKSETRLNISELQSGMYIMKVQTTNGTISKKLVKS